MVISLASEGLGSVFDFLGADPKGDVGGFTAGALGTSGLGSGVSRVGAVGALCFLSRRVHHC